MANAHGPRPPQRRDPRRGRPRRGRLPGDGLPRRQRLAQGQPGHPPRPSRRPIAELGYVPNRAARSLVTRRSDSIGVVITEPTGRLFSDPFFPRLLRGISAALSARDLQLVLLMPASPAETERTADYLTAGHVDGALLVSLHGDDPLPARMAAAGIPMVARRPAAAGRAVELRRRRQPRRRPERRRPPHRRRPAGHRDDRRPGRHGRRRRPARRLPRRARRAPASATDPTLEAVGDFTQEGGAAAMERLLAARPDIDAVFAASDLMAAGALTVLDGRRPAGPRGRRGRRLRRLAGRLDLRPPPHQRPPADRGDGPRDGPPARSTPSRARTPCHGA